MISKIGSKILSNGIRARRIDVVEEKLGLIQDQLQAMSTQIQNQGTDMKYVKHKMDELSTAMAKLPESHNYDLDSAVSTFFGTNTAAVEDAAGSFPPRRNPNRSADTHSRSASPPPSFDLQQLASGNPYNLRSRNTGADRKQPGSRSTGWIRSFADLNRPADYSGSDSNEPQGYYVGGERSGMLVQDPKRFCDRRRYVSLLPVFAIDPSSHYNRESVITSLGSENEPLKRVYCSERGQKVETQSGISSNTLPALSETNGKHKNLTSLDSGLIVKSKSMERSSPLSKDEDNNSTSDALRVCFKRLVENLDSTDNAQTLAATVGVIRELASKEPRSYIPPAPEFYRILVDSSNNWVLIKVLKIFAELTKLEPRSAKKVIEPIFDHMKPSEAKSLVFECVRTIVSSFHEYEFAVKLAVAKIGEFLLDKDLNLRHLGLQGILLVASNHLWAVLENKEIVIESLSDVDRNIKLEAF